MLATKHYDIIIIGAGCAGLSFIKALNQLSQSYRILILEQAESIQAIPPKTWSFWTQKPDQFKNILWHEWDTWFLSTQSKKNILHSKRHRYQSIHSEHYLSDCIENIKNNPLITLLFDQPVIDVTYPSKKRCRIQTPSNLWSCDWLIDTRPVTVKDDCELVQSFIGHYIESETPIFDDAQAGLMTRLSTNQGIIKFIYFLPKNKYTALIESTCIHPPHLKPNLERYIAEDIRHFCDNKPINITRSETGKLPMTAKHFKQPKHPRHILAGQAAGALRPSSGYGFKRILHWAKHAAFHFHKTHTIPRPKYHMGLQHQLDRIFLNTLTKHPQYAPLLFMRLANTLNGDEFAQFMMDATTLSIWYKIIKALPTKIMLTGLTKHHDIFTH